MGVPKFFRWISERYPCLSVYIERNQIPEFDCLYLDMNGIIHNCSHGNDHLRVISESEMFKKMFDYIDHLFKIIKPKEVFYLAVDGVAPRAKMNQQRSRRFKSALERKNQVKASIEKGELKPGDEIFDSNAITPGTEFMVRLDIELKKFIENKMQSDILWQGVKVIYSGHETPGEGEHKIQEYIRFRRSMPDYNPYTKHCLYGLDADLIILGLASHEPYFALLREEVLFYRNKDKSSNPKPAKFHLLYISLLRDYIELEFQDLKPVLGSDFNLERLYDDWIIMTFFVGNDFIPHLPCLHIHSSALPRLWQNYKEIRPKMQGYLVNKGVIDVANLMVFISGLAHFDKEMFDGEYEDMKCMMGKRGQKMGDMLEQLGSTTSASTDTKPPAQPIPDVVEGAAETFGGIHDNLQNLNSHDEVDMPNKDEGENELALFFGDKVVDDKTDKFEPLQDIVPVVTRPIPLVLDSEQDEMTDEEVFKYLYKAHKRNYYHSKMGFNSEQPEVVEQLSLDYLRAFQWISFYYFCGVQSWSWYYPQHYAPFLSDLPTLPLSWYSDVSNFELSTPFLPFQQLLAVLPPDSSKLIPDCYRELMLLPDSPIIDFYPRSFNSDLNGKKADWEALVLIPFIDEVRLIEAMQLLCNKITTQESRRNIHGPSFEYTYCTDAQEIKDGSRVLKNTIELDSHRLPRKDIVYGLLFESDGDANWRLDLIRHGGFPTLFSQSSNIRFSASLEEKFEVKLFEASSRKPCTVLRILPRPQVDNQDDTTEIMRYLSRVVYVNWPVISQVKVTSVVKGSVRYRLNPITNEVTSENLEKCVEVRSQINYFRESETRRLSFKKAIVADDANDIVLESLHSAGRKYYLSKSLQLNSEVIWDETKQHMYLEQLSIIPEKGTKEFGGLASAGVCTKINQLAPEGSSVFLMDPENYGRMAKVVGYNELNGNLIVEINGSNHVPIEYLDISKIKQLDLEYMTQFELLDYLPVNIDYNIISRITGYLPVKQSPRFTVLGKKQKSVSHFNVGLNMKTNKGPGQLADWLLKIPYQQDSSGKKGNNNIGGWKFTVQVAKLLDDYTMKFPEIFEFLAKSNWENMDTADIFKESCVDDEDAMETKLNQLKDFLADLPFNTVPRLQHEHQILRQKAIKHLESISVLTQSEHALETMEVPLSSIWCPHPSLATACPDLTVNHNLLDRVVCVVPVSLSCSIPVPLGAQGVIIGIEPVSISSGFCTLEILFDSPFNGAISIRNSSERCYKLPENFVINLTHNYCKKHNISRLQDNESESGSKSSQPKENAWKKTDVVSEVNTATKITETSREATKKTTKNTTNSSSKYIKKTSNKVLTVTNIMQSTSSSVGEDKINKTAECSFDFDADLPPQPPMEFLQAGASDNEPSNNNTNNNNNNRKNNSTKKAAKLTNKSLSKLPKSDISEGIILRARDVVTVTNCGVDYGPIIKWCLQQQITDPSLTVNFYEDQKTQDRAANNSYVGMYFTCKFFEVPEIITSSWQDTINQMYYSIEVNVQQLYTQAMYQIQQRNQFNQYNYPSNLYHQPYQYPSYVNVIQNVSHQHQNLNNQYQHSYNQYQSAIAAPDQIMNNPFTQSYQNQQYSMNRFMSSNQDPKFNKPTTNKSPVKPHNNQSLSSLQKPNNSNTFNSVNNEAKKSNRQNKKFTKAPKPNIGINFSK